MLNRSRRRLRGPVVAAVAVAVTLAATAEVPAMRRVPALYGCDTVGNLYRFNLMTGTPHYVGSMNPMEPPALAGGGPALSGATEIEYSNRYWLGFVQRPNGSFGGQFLEMATARTVSPFIFNGMSFQGMEVVGDVLFAAGVLMECGPSLFGMLTPWDGLFLPIGETGWGPLSGLAYDYATATMYAVTGCPAPPDSNETRGLPPGSVLLTVDMNTGFATPVAGLGEVFGSLEFGPDGNLYAGSSRRDPMGPGLYRIDDYQNRNGGPVAVRLGPATTETTISGLAMVRRLRRPQGNFDPVYAPVLGDGGWPMLSPDDVEQGTWGSLRVMFK